MCKALGSINHTLPIFLIFVENCPSLIDHTTYQKDTFFVRFRFYLTVLLYKCYWATWLIQLFTSTILWYPYVISKEMRDLLSKIVLRRIWNTSFYFLPLTRLLTIYSIIWKGHKFDILAGCFENICKKKLLLMKLKKEKIDVLWQLHEFVCHVHYQHLGSQRIDIKADVKET